MKNILLYLLPRAFAVVLASLIAYGCVQPGGFEDSSNASNRHSTAPITVTIDNQSSIEVGQVNLSYGNGDSMATYVGYQGTYTYFVPSTVNAVVIQGTSMSRNNETAITINGTTVYVTWEGNVITVDTVGIQ